eukprot:15339654-Ditylum_brightwellii.AAC.1
MLNLKAGHINPHVTFDDEFTTVPYLQSSEAPPNWADLVAKYSEKVTEQAFAIASTWYEGEEADKADTLLPTAVDERATPHTHMREHDRPFINLYTIGLRRSPKLQQLRIQVWEKVPRQEMLHYYAELRKTRKRHADGSLSKYKARLFCHGGQHQ